VPNVSGAEPSDARSTRADGGRPARERQREPQRRARLRRPIKRDRCKDLQDPVGRDVAGKVGFEQHRAGVAAPVSAPVSAPAGIPEQLP
jgi:hypothetical protein